MFTGLVEDIGEVRRVTPRGQGLELAISTRIPLAEVKVGDSIAVDGVCLTAERCVGDVFYALAGAETRAKSTLGRVSVGRRVHLERALALGDRLDGHLVQGHVDGLGEVVSVRDAGESWIYWLRVPSALLRYIAGKGSLCVDGVSLTVNEIQGEQVRLNLVPHSIEVTRFGGLRSGDAVNLEVDVIAKYVERLLGLDAQHGLTLERLGALGFAPNLGAKGRS